MYSAESQFLLLLHGACCCLCSLGICFDVLCEKAEGADIGSGPSVVSGVGKKIFQKNSASLPFPHGVLLWYQNGQGQRRVVGEEHTHKQSESTYTFPESAIIYSCCTVLLENTGPTPGAIVES